MTYPFPGQSPQPGTPYPGSGALYPAGFPGVSEGPLDGLQGSVANVLNAADSHHVYLPTGPGGPVLQVPRGRQPSVARGMAYGAAIGFTSWLIWQRTKSRKARKGEYTHPAFRFFAIWWGFMIAGFGLSMIWIMETGWFLGIAFVTGSVLSLAYLISRATGHGRYNTRRPGSPWRQTRRGRS